MIKCPNADCGYENVDGTQFCEGCGEELPQNGASSASAATGTATANAPISTTASATSGAPTQIKCPACENMNPADNVVCEVCGTELHPKTAAPSSTPISSTGNAAIAAADTLASGTATPNIGAITSSATGGDTATTLSADAPVALTSVAPDVSVTTAMPVATSGDTTSGVSPTGTTLPTGDASLTFPASMSAPVAGGDAVAVAPIADTAPSDTTPSVDMQPGHVKLTVEQGMTIGKQFVLGDPEVLVGREDEEEQIFPDIDLSDQDEGYVHRKHAQFKFENGKLTLTHLGGANRTRVNNRPLEDNVPQDVKIGDKVSFGKVVMRVGSV